MLQVLHRFIYVEEITTCFWIIIQIISHYFVLGTRESNVEQIDQCVMSLSTRHGFEL